MPSATRPVARREAYQPGPLRRATPAPMRATALSTPGGSTAHLLAPRYETPTCSITAISAFITLPPAQIHRLTDGVGNAADHTGEIAV